MRKIAFFMGISYLLAHATLCSYAQNIISVSNAGGISADYTEIQDAVDAANPNDIIMVYGSGARYGDVTLDKPLQLIGPGYFLAENANTQANLTHAEVSNITCSPGSQGSLVTGFYIISRLTADTSTLIFSRNEVSQIYLNNASNVVSVENYILNNIVISGVCSNLIIGNNLVLSKSSTASMFLSGSMDAYIYNNYFFNSISVAKNSVFKNNIFKGGVSTATNNFFNNVFTYDVTTLDGNGNTENVDINTLFVGYPTQGNYSTDGRFQLAPNSPAIGAGENGVDCGVFGGADPYVLSGIPNYGPHIYDLTVPTSGTTSGGLQVTVKAKSGN